MSAAVGHERSFANVTRVVVVDDSRSMRDYLRAILDAHQNISVVGTAANADQARQVIRNLSPDVITLDIQMSEMDGIEFLRRIMKLRPMPVVMVTGQSRSQTDLALKTLEIGAVGLIAKPNNPAGRKVFGDLLCATVLTATQARFNQPRADQQGLKRPLTNATTDEIRNRPRRRLPQCELVAFGASTGGVSAISHLLERLRAIDPLPPIVIAQHMPGEFTASFAKRLADNLGFDVSEALAGEALKPGMVRIAPGGRHLRINRTAGRLVSAVTDDAPINNHRPSVDALFSSIASSSGEKAIGVILTGMGRDGAKGLLKMRRAGAYTLGEGQSSCIVYGMPAAAKRIGAVKTELDITDLADHLTTRLSEAQAPPRRGSVPGRLNVTDAAKPRPDHGAD